MATDQNIIVDEAKEQMFQTPMPSTVGSQPQTDPITNAYIADMLQQNRQQQLQNRGNADYFPTNTGQVTQGAGNIGNYGMVTIAPTQGLMPFAAANQQALQRQLQEDELNKQRIYNDPDFTPLDNSPANVEYQKSIVANLENKFLIPYKQQYGKDFNIYLQRDPEYRRYVKNVENVTKAYNQTYANAAKLLDTKNKLGATPEMRREAQKWLNATNNMMLSPESFDINEMAESTKKLNGFIRVIDSVKEVTDGMKEQGSSRVIKDPNLSTADYNALLTLEANGAFLTFDEDSQKFVFDDNKFEEFAKSGYDNYYEGYDFAPEYGTWKNMLKNSIKSDVDTKLNTPGLSNWAFKKASTKWDKEIDLVDFEIVPESEDAIFDLATGTTKPITVTNAYGLPAKFTFNASPGTKFTDKTSGKTYSVSEESAKILKFNPSKVGYTVNPIQAIGADGPLPVTPGSEEQVVFANLEIPQEKGSVTFDIIDSDPNSPTYNEVVGKETVSTDEVRQMSIITPVNNVEAELLNADVKYIDANRRALKKSREMQVSNKPKTTAQANTATEGILNDL